MDMKLANEIKKDFDKANGRSKSKKSKPAKKQIKPVQHKVLKDNSVNVTEIIIGKSKVRIWSYAEYDVRSLRITIEGELFEYVSVNQEPNKLEVKDE